MEVISMEIRPDQEGQNLSIKRSFAGLFKYLVSCLAILFSLFHLYCAVYPISTPALKSIHLSFGLVIGFLIFPLIKTKGKPLSKIILFVDIVLALLSILCGAYIALFQEQISLHLGIATTFELILGTMLILLVLDAARRLVGMGMTLICIAAIFYSLFGDNIPGMFGHIGFDWAQITGQMYTSSEGIYGIPIDVSASFVFLFILFGAFLEECGGGEFFMEIALSLFGRFRGGPAKVAVISSNLFGMISGSAVANVVVDGWLTIPLMKKSGYRPHVAGAVEAVASSGGQFMPPVMGAAAFIIPTMIGSSYFNVAAAAFIPGMLYYFSTYLMVDFEAKKMNLLPLSKDQVPSFKEVFKKKFHLLIPIFVLIYFLVIKMSSPSIAAFWAIISVILASFLRKSTRMTPKKILNALEKGAIESLPVVAACAGGGIIIGNVALTGLGLSLSMLLVDIAAGSLIILLILTMISSLILGMGLTTTACYIILAVLVAPALIKMGVSAMAAHLFIFYFGIISAITLPVALVAYAAAGIANTSPIKTGYAALRIGIAGFILPYLFVYRPSLILEGSVFMIIYTILISSVALYMVAASIIGYMLTDANFFERIVFVVSGILILFPGWKTDVAGITIAIVAILFQYIKWSRLKKSGIGPIL